MSDSEGESNNKIVLEQAKMNKRIAKANLTKLENWFNSKVDVEISSTLLELKIDQLTNAYTKFSIAIETLEDESLILSSPDESEAFDERYCMLMSNLKTRLSQLSKNSEVKSERTQNLSIPPTVHLPEIKIPIFSGNPTEWVSFFQLFEAIILNNQSLPAVQKFVYLKSFLRDEPLKLIQNISVSHQNFQVALDILKKRYDNKHVLANSLISGILDINPITKGTAEQLRDFHTNVNKNLEALKNLNLTSEQMVDMFLIYSLERKLDYATKRNFEFERDNSHYPTLNEFLGSIDDRCIGLENLKSLDGSSATNKKLQKVSLTTEVSTNLNSLVQIQGQCIFCHGTHKIYSCERFRALPHSEKYNFIKSKQLCVNCFGKHPTSNCASKFLCSVCNKNHHTILHDNKFTNSVTQRGQNKNKSNHITQQSNTNFSRPETRAFNQSGSVPNVSDRETTSHPQEQISQTLNVLSVNKTNSHVLLGTAQVFMYSSEGRKVKAKAILDPGSQHSFITSKLVRNLGYTTYDSKLSISGIGISSTMSNSMVNLVAHSEIDKFKIKLSCSVLENITSSLPQILIDHAKIKLPSQVKLADETYFSPSSIDILIGADFYYELLLDGIIRLGKNLPVLISTRLGWIVVGHAPQKINSSISSWSGVTATTSLSSVESCEESSNAAASAVVLHSQANDFCNLETMVERFWTLEQIPDPKINLSTEEELVENTFISTTHQLEGGSFQVDLPLKSPHENIKLGRSLPIAKQRFFNLEKRFRNNSNYFVDYKRFIDEYIHLGHGRYVPLSEYNANSELKYFLPHHAVLRQDAVTTKLRVVFDASCKTDSGLSLNDIMYKGFQVQPNLFDILLRFRSYNYVLVGDIEKMFRCIQVNPSHTFLQNILWRDNPEQPLRCIELTTLTFGTNCAPFLATRVLNKIAMDNEYKFPLASKSLLSQTYVDDILSGCNSFDELQRLYSELSAMLNPCGFHLHKWHSNSKEFSKKFSLSTSAEIDLNKEEATSKVLGLKWNTLNDCFTISVPKFEIFGPITKRKILSCVAQCWDPLGFLAPVVILGKLIIKATWNMKVNWDTEINDELITLEWNKFIQNIYSLNSLTIPRYFFSGKTISSIQILGFSDASSKAYAACIYVRALYDDGTISSHLATSKSRVAPQKVISIPRLELSAMLLLVQLVNTFLTVFRETLSFSEIHLYSDSEIALYWISSLPSRWTTFVANRVSKIQSASSQCKWHFVKSQENPADLPSRGVQPCELLNSTLWWHGPHFLNQNPLNLKSFQTEKEVHAASQEAKRITLLVKSEQNCDEFWEPLFLKFSNFSKCQSVLAYVIRFINNIRLSKAKADKSTGGLFSFQSNLIRMRPNVKFSNEMQKVYFRVIEIGPYATFFDRFISTGLEPIEFKIRARI